LFHKNNISERIKFHQGAEASFMFLSKTESKLKRLLSPFGYRTLNRMIHQGFPDQLLRPLEFLLSPTLTKEDQLVVDKVEKIRTEFLQKDDQYVVIRSSGIDDSSSSQAPTLVERKLRWLAEIASITKYWGTFLYLCANAMKAETILELGSCAGVSSCYLASTASCKNFIAIEGSKDLSVLVESNLRQVTDHFKVVCSLFDAGLNEVLPSLESGLDLVFIDGDHTKSATLHYFHRIKPFLKKDSVLLFDDIHWSKDMWHAWKEICESPGLAFTVNLGRIGLCIWDGDEKNAQSFNLSKFTIDWGWGRTK
jgi:predicted O-methyltransferase YrrM